LKLRQWVGAALVLAWLGAVGVHVRREYFRPEALVLAEGAQSLAPGSYFYTVRMNGRAIGLASSRLDTVPEGFVFEDILRLEVPAMDTVHPATVRTRARLGHALELLDFDFRLDSEIGEFRVRGEAADDSTLRLSLDAGSRDQATALPMDRSMTLPVALPLRMAAAGRLDVGLEYSARVFDPSSMADRGVTVRVTGRDMVAIPDSVARRADGYWTPVRFDTIPVWVVEESYGGVSVTSRLDNDGRLVRAESPMGFTLLRMPYELADQAWQAARSDPALARGYGSVIENTAIAADADLTGREESIQRLEVRLRNVQLEGFDLDGGRQELRGDTLVVHREESSPRASYTLPYAIAAGGERAAGLSSPPGPESLEATPLIQSEDPRIVEVAREIAGGETRPEVMARRLTDWVHDRLRKDITLSIPSAVQVLELGQGDCNEHTVLYVALARALGLPARTAVGLVHVDGRFFYHAWPEVWLDGWVAADPTLDQYPADAMHLRFLVGGLARQVELIRLIGRLDLEIVGTS
jgi:transglutaminase-like putative cysteine protease